MSSPDYHDDWRLEDLIDFESFVLDDSALDEKKREDRDGTIYKKAIAPYDPNGSLANRRLLRFWLESRRTELRTAGEDLLGERFIQANHLLLLGLGLVGLGLGVSYAGVHLHYSGDQPINTFWFFLIVPAQIAVLVLVALHRLIEKGLRRFKGFAPIWGILLRFYSSTIRLTGRAANPEKREGIDAVLRSYRNTERLGPILDRLERILCWIGGRRERLVSQGTEMRSAFGAVLNRIRGRTSIYGNVLVWPLVTLTQVFTVCFNAAIITAVLLMVTFSNRGFGWESTLDFGPEAVHGVVRCIAFPWAWLPNAYPTLEHVQGSRIPLHGAAQHEYPPGALPSWWPFLCYAVFFYGFLPRAAILLVARARQASSLAALQFNDVDSNAIVRRLRPVIDSSAEPTTTNEINGNTPASKLPFPHDRYVITIVARDAIVVDGALDMALRRLNLAERGRIDAAVFPDDEESLVAQIRAIDWQDVKPQFVVVMDVAQAPIHEHRLFLGQLRSVAGREASITVLLLPCAKSKKDYSPFWEEMIAKMHDPYFECKSFPHHA